MIFSNAPERTLERAVLAGIDLRQLVGVCFFMAEPTVAFQRR